MRHYVHCFIIEFGSWDGGYSSEASSAIRLNKDYYNKD